MHLLVTGASGLVGSALVSQAARRGVRVLAVAHSHPELVPEAKGVQTEVADLGGGDDLPGDDVDAVVHCAAMTDLDRCKERPDLAYRVNVEATGRIARSSRRRGADFLYISTHSVFGTEGGGCTEDQTPSPSNLYDVTKAAGEAVTQASDGTVIRMMPVGVHPSREVPGSFGEWLVGEIRRDEDLQLWSDVRFNPTTPRRCADFLLDLLRSGPPVSSALHLGSRDVLSKAELGHAVLDRVQGYAGSVEEEEIGTRDPEVPRPREIWVSVDRTEELTDYAMPDSREVVEELVDAVESDNARDAEEKP